jgi:PhnB protein
MAAKPIPEGRPTLIPSLSVPDCARAIEYYKRAFGMRESARYTAPDGSVAHCELEIGDSVLMLGEPKDHPPFTLHAMIYVEDVDAVFARAVAAGGTSKQEPANQFYGDRTARVVDPFGNEWYLGTHVEDVSESEMRRRFEAMTIQAAE